MLPILKEILCADKCRTRQKIAIPGCSGGFFWRVAARAFGLKYGTRLKWRTPMSRLVTSALASKIVANRMMTLLGVCVFLLATSSTQAQSWPFKKKPGDPPPASAQKDAKQPDNKDPKSSATPSPVANYGGPKMRLPVMDLSGSGLKVQTSATPASSTTTVAIPPPSDFARGMTEMLTTALMKTNRFVVLERAAMDKVVGEQDFGAGGRVNAETAPKVGKIIGGQALITGDIT